MNAALAVLVAFATAGCADGGEIVATLSAGSLGSGPTTDADSSTSATTADSSTTADGSASADTSSSASADSTGSSSTTDPTDGTTGEPATPGQTQQQIVGVGQSMASANYRMEFTLGQPSSLQSTHVSANYRLQGGLVGANGNPP